jgi:Mitochondrial carrier protein
MAGNYPNLPQAIKGLYTTQGIKGFYSGWFPGLAGKIPSYALTWTLFQQFKAMHRRAFNRPPKDIENSIMGCLSSATTVTIMIPLDTIKTRLVTQGSMVTANPYKGIVDCAVRVYREEGLKTFYRGLPPRLISVVPMIGIQFGVYEFMKRIMQERSIEAMSSMREVQAFQERADSEATFEETAMEVAADTIQPFPAPQFHVYEKNEVKAKRNQR